jgi:flagellar biosynthesis anti-sigma factor FlgM
VTTISNGGKDPQRTNDLLGATRTSRPSRPQGNLPGQAPAGGPTGSPEVSAQGGKFLSLRARLEALEANRAERVERLRQLVAEGRYQPDSEATAAAMLADPATAAALGVR